MCIHLTAAITCSCLKYYIVYCRYLTLCTLTLPLSGSKNEHCYILWLCQSSYPRLFQRHKTTGVKLPTARSQGSQILDDYNEPFKNYPNLQVPLSVLKRVPKLLKSFNKKWHPAEKMKSYLQVFSLRSWAEAPENEKKSHTLRNCHVCGTKYQANFSAF